MVDDCIPHVEIAGVVVDESLEDSPQMPMCR